MRKKSRRIRGGGNGSFKNKFLTGAHQWRDAAQKGKKKAEEGYEKAKFNAKQTNQAYKDQLEKNRQGEAAEALTPMSSMSASVGGRRKRRRSRRRTKRRRKKRTSRKRRKSRRRRSRRRRR